MDERTMRFRVGVMVLGALIVTAILLVMFGKLPNLIPGNKGYPVQIRFDYAAGVSKGTPIRKSGILIGRVIDVQLTNEDSKVLVTAEIQPDKKIYRNEDCYIIRELLGGDTALAFIASPRKPGAGELIEPGVVLPGRFSDDPTGLKQVMQEPIDTVTGTGRALTDASKKLGAAADRVEDILNDQTKSDVQSILRDAAKTMKDVQTILGNEENRTKLAEAVNKLPQTIDNMNRTFAATEDTLGQFTKRSGKDNKTPIERMVGTIEMTERTLRKFSESDDPDKAPPIEQIAAAMNNIGEITALMRTIMSRIEQGDGSLGALLNDRQLYNRLNKAAKNVEEVSQKLEPIVDDVRVITDKMARHPGGIIRDAVKPGVGIK